MIVSNGPCTLYEHSKYSYYRLIIPFIIILTSKLNLPVSIFLYLILFLVSPYIFIPPSAINTTYYIIQLAYYI